MPMGFDQPRHDDHAGAVDPLPAALHILADRDDLAVPDMHRTIRDIAEHAVHRHHMGIGDGELAAWGKLRCADVAAPCLRQQGRRKHSGCTERGRATHETTPADLAHAPSLVRIGTRPIVNCGLLCPTLYESDIAMPFQSPYFVLGVWGLALARATASVVSGPASIGPLITSSVCGNVRRAASPSWRGKMRGHIVADPILENE